MANYKNTVKNLAHKLSDLAYDSSDIPALRRHHDVIASAIEHKVSLEKMANDIHHYRNGFQYQKELLKIN